MIDLAGLMYEDELPADMSQRDYDRWFEESHVIDGVRMGPLYPDLYSVGCALPDLGLVLRVTAIGAAVGVVLSATAIVAINKIVQLMGLSRTAVDG